MIGYNFYWHDDVKGFQFVGVVHERRKDPARITHESIVNLGRKLFGDQADIKRIYFVRVKLGEVSLRSWDPLFDSNPDRMISRGVEWNEMYDLSEHEAWGKGVKDRFGG
jgi:hypothetical protein